MRTKATLVLQTRAVSVEFCVQCHVTLSPIAAALPPSYHTESPAHPVCIHCTCNALCNSTR